MSVLSVRIGNLNIWVIAMFVGIVTGLLGYLVAISSLEIASIVLTLALVSTLRFAGLASRNGTSGGVGVLFVCLLFWTASVLPAWLGYAIRHVSFDAQIHFK